jgi:hypothetical protein
LFDEHDGQNGREGQQDVDNASDEIDPDVAERLDLLADESPGQRDEDRHA